MRLIADGKIFEIKNRRDVELFVPTADTYDCIYPEFDEGIKKYAVVLNGNIVARTHYKREAQLYAYYSNLRCYTFMHQVKQLNDL